MYKLAENRGGKCLSNKYINNCTKLQWQCKEGHVWNSTPSSIKNGSWCTICSIKHVADKQKLTIEEMQEIAESREGKCLSKEYINTRTKLQWKCKEGHIWLALSCNIKKGSWCPICSRRKSNKDC